MHPRAVGGRRAPGGTFLYISDSLVFIDLPKTASSHVRRLLADITPGRESGVHVRAPRRLRQSRKHFWGTIRDPWDWYVSLWAYGCDGKGALHHALTSDLGWLRSRGWKHSPLAALRALAGNPRTHREAWRQAYADADSPEGFRHWLRMVHDPSCAPDLGDAYAASGLSGFAGLLTWRYLRLYCDGSPRGLADTAALQRFDATNGYITRFIRTDRLESDLAAAFNDIGLPLSDEQREEMDARRRSNRSSRRRDLSWYYDRELAALVHQRDRLVVERFGFEPPVPVVGPDSNHAPTMRIIE